MDSQIDREGERERDGDRDRERWRKSKRDIHRNLYFFVDFYNILEFMQMT